MIVAISTSGNNLESDVDSRFGRCNSFLLYDTTIGTFKILENKAQNEGHGAGVSAAQALVDEGIEAVISGNIGPNAFSILQNANINMYSFFGRISDALSLLEKNQLPTVGSPRKATGMGMGRGRGGFKD